MRKLKKKSNGKIFDCTILIDNCDIVVVYWDGISWICERIDAFIPAIPEIDY